MNIFLKNYLNATIEGVALAGKPGEIINIPDNKAESILDGLQAYGIGYSVMDDNEDSYTVSQQENIDKVRAITENIQRIKEENAE